MALVYESSAAEKTTDDEARCQKGESLYSFFFGCEREKKIVFSSVLLFSSESERERSSSEQKRQRKGAKEGFFRTNCFLASLLSFFLSSKSEQERDSSERERDSSEQKKGGEKCCGEGRERKNERTNNFHFFFLARVPRPSRERIAFIARASLLCFLRRRDAIVPI